MGTLIVYQAERNVGGKWSVLKDRAGQRDFFFFGTEQDRVFWDILCGEIDPQTGETYYGFVPIASLRGPPPDYPTGRPHGYVDHGTSWLLLQELIDYPWEAQTRKVRAFVDAASFRAYIDNDFFRYFAVTPPHLECPVRYPLAEWTIISQEQMLNLLCSSGSSANCYTEIEFMRPHDVSIFTERILTDTIPKLSQFGDPHEIRVVFSFIF